MDVDARLRQQRVHGAQHARHVAVHMQDAQQAILHLRQIHLREVDRRGRGAVLPETRQLLGHIHRDGLLRLLGAAADVRREDDVAQSGERRAEALTVLGGLFGEHVGRGAREMAAAQCRRERLDAPVNAHVEMTRDQVERQLQRAFPKVQIWAAVERDIAARRDDHDGVGLAERRNVRERRQRSEGPALVIEARLGDGRARVQRDGV